MSRAWRLGPRLREEPVDRKAFAAEVDQLLGEITTARSHPARLLARLFRNRLALAQVMQREGRFELATPLFDQLIAQSRSSPELTPFLHDVLFSAGVNLFDQGRIAEAARCFRDSQTLRRAANLEDLLEMSAEALRQTDSRASTPR